VRKARWQNLTAYKEAGALLGEGSVQRASDRFIAGAQGTHDGRNGLSVKSLQLEVRFGARSRGNSQLWSREASGRARTLGGAKDDISVEDEVGDVIRVDRAVEKRA